MSATTATPTMPFKLRRACVVAGKEARAGEVVDLVELPLHRIAQLERSGYGMRVNEPVPDEWYERPVRETAAEPDAETEVEATMGTVEESGSEFGLDIEPANSPAKATGATKKRGGRSSSTRKAPTTNGRRSAKK